MSPFPFLCEWQIDFNKSYFMFEIWKSFLLFSFLQCKALWASDINALETKLLLSLLIISIIIVIIIITIFIFILSSSSLLSLSLSLLSSSSLLLLSLSSSSSSSSPSSSLLSALLLTNLYSTEPSVLQPFLN